MYSIQRWDRVQGSLIINWQSSQGAILYQEVGREGPFAYSKPGDTKSVYLTIFLIRVKKWGGEHSLSPQGLRSGGYMSPPFLNKFHPYESSMLRMDRWMLSFWKNVQGKIIKINYTYRDREMYLHIFWKHLGTDLFQVAWSFQLVSFG